MSSITKLTNTLIYFIFLAVTNPEVFMIENLFTV